MIMTLYHYTCKYSSCGGDGGGNTVRTTEKGEGNSPIEKKVAVIAQIGK